MAEFYKSRPKSFDEKSPYFRWEREWSGQDIQDAVQANIATQSLTGFVTPVVAKDETIGIIKSLNVFCLLYNSCVIEKNFSLTLLYSVLGGLQIKLRRTD